MARMNEPQVKSPAVGTPSTIFCGGSRLVTAATCAVISFCKNCVTSAANWSADTVGCPWTKVGEATNAKTNNGVEMKRGRGERFMVEFWRRIFVMPEKTRPERSG